MTGKARQLGLHNLFDNSAPVLQQVRYVSHWLMQVFYSYQQALRLQQFWHLSRPSCYEIPNTSQSS